MFLFYSILPILLYRGNLDIMALLVFIVLMITLPVTVVYWIRNTGDEKFRKIYKIWKVLYQTVNMLAIYRYLMFFARYAIVERLLVRMFCRITGTEIDADLSSSQQIEKIDWGWKNLFLKDLQSRKTSLDELYKDFYIEILLIILNFVTLIAFQKRLGNQALEKEEKREENIEKQEIEHQ